MVVDFDGLTIIVGTVFYLLFCAVIHKRHRKKKVFYIFFTIMFVYFMCVIKQTLFPIVFIDGMPSNIYQSINFVPLRGGVNITDLQNLIMTIPLGVGMPFITRIRSLKGILVLGSGTGIAIVCHSGLRNEGSPL